MKGLFNKTFFRFVAGFTLIIFLGFVGLYFSTTIPEDVASLGQAAP